MCSSQAKLRINNSFLNLFKHLVTEFAEGLTHILNILLYDLFKQGSQFEQGSISHVFEPGFDENTVIGLQDKVFSNVVDNYAFIQGSSNFTQVFNEDHSSGRGMLSVKTVRNAFLFVDLVKHPVSVVLHGSSKNDDFVDLTHLFQEFIAARSNAEGAFTSNLIIMNKSFVEIKD